MDISRETKTPKEAREIVAALRILGARTLRIHTGGRWLVKDKSTFLDCSPIRELKCRRALVLIDGNDVWATPLESGRVRIIADVKTLCA